MARITQVSDAAAGPEAAALFTAIKGKIGMVPNLYRVAATGIDPPARACPPAFRAPAVRRFAPAHRETVWSIRACSINVPNAAPGWTSGMRSLDSQTRPHDAMRHVLDLVPEGARDDAA